MTERLQKVIAAHGIASRRQAENLIHEGKVLVNGVVAVIGQSVDLAHDDVVVDGIALTKADDFVYLMINKPRGYLSTVRDDRGRATVMSLVSDVGVRIYPIGRLDLDTEGLLLLTNDGEFANTVMHPSFEVEKMYEIHVSGDAERAAKLLKEPFDIDGFTVRAVSTELVSISRNGGVVNIVIKEGRNRQIRKMCAMCGVSIHLLRRMSVGSLRLGELEIGKWRFLSKKEVGMVVSRLGA